MEHRRKEYSNTMKQIIATNIITALLCFSLLAAAVLHFSAV